MSIITFELFIIFFLAVINGIFAMSEIALVSSRKARLQQWAETGSRKARLALETSNAPEDFLSTVQVGITLVGILAGAFGGATIAQHLSAAISVNPLFGSYAETIAVGIVVLGITYLSLIVGELVPKRIALRNPERIAIFVVRPMRFLSRIAAPAVWLLNTSTNAILWLFRVRTQSEPPITEEEIRILLRQGTEAGIFERNERDIVDRVFRLGERRSGTIMTRRMDLVVFYVSDTAEQIREKVARSGHTTFPLCEETLDNVLGIVRTQDILTQILRGAPIDLKGIVRQPMFVPDSVLTLRLLDDFRKTGKDTALLLDEYGGLQGLITATDILKTLLGEVSYLGIPKAELQPDGSWLIDGMLPTDELIDALKVGTGGGSLSVETAGGLMMVLLGRIPKEGDIVSWDRFDFKILDMDGMRVDKILATPASQGSAMDGSASV